MNTVEKIKQVCKSRNIPISKLEKDLGFANGYIGQLKKGSVPFDRLIVIAAYLDMNVYEFCDFDEVKQQYGGHLSAVMRGYYEVLKDSFRSSEAVDAPDLDAPDLSEDETELLRLFRMFNESGRNRALCALKELSEIPRYTDKSKESSISGTA